MKCYFHGSNLSENKLARKQGLISFSIPDYGVVFRSQYEGNCYETEYAAAIALIRFMQLNENHFHGRKVMLLTDSPIVVYQVNNKLVATKKLQRSRDLLLYYKRKMGFDLQWIPSSMNRAEASLEEIAVNLQSPKFNYDIFDESTKRKEQGQPHGRAVVKIM